MVEKDVPASTLLYQLLLTFVLAKSKRQNISTTELIKKCHNVDLVVSE